MLSPEKLAAFVVVTGIATIVPGPQMIFAMTQSVWCGARGGVAALAGLQLGNLTWYALGGLGLGTLAAAFPATFTVLTAAGAMYLAWLGWQALRHAGQGGGKGIAQRGKPSARAVRDGLAVSLSNPKAIVYVTALLPPFIDPRAPVMPQIALLAAIGIAIDVTVGLVYVAAGNGLSAFMARASVRTGLARTVGVIFLLLAGGVLYSLVALPRSAP